MTTLNLSWLEDFLALAASGNFSRAADERHMTQPAFSRRIKALETWVGAELFDRRNQPATLTDTGQWFSGIATDMLAKAAKIPGEARAFSEANAKRPVHRELNFQVPPSISRIAAAAGSKNQRGPRFRRLAEVTAPAGAWCPHRQRALCLCDGFEK